MCQEKCRCDAASQFSGPHTTPPPKFPAICRAVIFYDQVDRPYGPPLIRPCPAVIQEVDDPSSPHSDVELFVQSSHGYTLHKVPYGPGKADCWGWPPVR